MRSILIALVLLTTSTALWAEAPIRLFAAASLAPVLEPLTQRYQQQQGVQVLTIYAASSTLARQIHQGAPADLYLSANQRWMDYLQQQQHLKPGQRKTLLRNRLVLIEPITTSGQRPTPPTLHPDWPLAEQLAEQRLALADPAHVPAGLYAKEALQSLQLWPQVRQRLAPSRNVRGALALVEQGEVALGIVYRTDALASRRVQIAARVPTSSHTPIEYPLALTRTAAPAAVDLFDYLGSADARALFRQYGFELPAIDTPACREPSC